MFELSDTVPGPDQSARAAAIGRVAAVLFIAGAVASLPGLFVLMAREPASWAYALPVLPLLSGLVCWIVPWRRLDPRWVHAIVPVALVEIAVLVIAVGEEYGPEFSWFYVLVGAFVAYAVASRAALAAHLVLVCLFIAAPIVYFDDTRGAVLLFLVSAPTIVVASLVIALLREQLAAGQRELRRLATRDPLTGVGNYRTLYESLAGEISRQRRHGGEFGVLVLDLDEFKAVNEELGHLAGDRLLRDVARAVTQVVRSEDTVARQGGDEFSVVAPGAGREEAVALAGRVEGALAKVSAIGPITASTGWAVCPGDGSTPESLLARADENQRRLKRALRQAEPANVRPIESPAATPVPSATQPRMRKTSPSSETA